MSELIPTARPKSTLFFISGLLLFIELACIRWFPAHVLYLTFFTNAVLLAAFVGMSIGCLLGERPVRLIRATAMLLALAIFAGVLIERIRPFLEQTVNVANQSNPDVIFFGAEAALFNKVNFRIPLELILGIFFVLITLVMVGPGQEMGRAFNRVPHRGQAYSMNLLGSLVGIILFALFSMFQVPPVVWFALIAIGLFVFLQMSGSQPTVMISLFLLAVPVLLGLSHWGIIGQHEVQMTTTWSPYYRIDYEPTKMSIRTNLIGHQQIQPRNEPAVEPYALPYVLQRDLPANTWPTFKRVLIIGAGSGNDLTRALQWCPADARIDAVEIDPVIQRIGVEHHPDQPYADPRVTVHLNDGRNFLRRAPEGEYDLVIFALIDSLVLQSGYSNLRLESYLFTAEAFRDVRRVLKPTGLSAVYNYFRQGWLTARLQDEIHSAFNAKPVLMTNPPKDYIAIDEFDPGFSIFLAGSEEVLAPLHQAFKQTGNTYWFPWATPIETTTPNGFRNANDPPAPLPATGYKVPLDHRGNPILPRWVRFRLADVEATPSDLAPATDDWPFLYTRTALIPTHTLRGIVLMVVLSLLLWWLCSRWAGVTNECATSPREWELLSRSFFLGAGFMLVETKAIVHMALLFGGTWIINTIVFATILLMSLLGNLIAIKFRPQHLGPIYVLLFISLALNIAIPMEFFLGLSPALQIAGACTLAFFPVTCAGIIFATSFGRSQRPNEMFGANVAGALVGGLAENLSMLLGFRYLVLVAVGFYLLSAFGNRRRPQAENHGLPDFRASHM